MRLNEVFRTAENYIQDNIVIAIFVAVGLIIIYIKKPNVIHTLIIVLLIAVGVMEIFHMVGSLGLKR